MLARMSSAKSFHLEYLLHPENACPPAPPSLRDNDCVCFHLLWLVLSAITIIIIMLRAQRSMKSVSLYVAVLQGVCGETYYRLSSLFQLLTPTPKKIPMKSQEAYRRKKYWEPGNALPPCHDQLQQFLHLFTYHHCFILLFPNMDSSENQILSWYQTTYLVNNFRKDLLFNLLAPAKI